MKLVLICWLLSTLFEALIVVTPLWKARETFIIAMLICGAFSMGVQLSFVPFVLTIPLVFIGSYRLFNVFRLRNSIVSSIQLRRSYSKGLYWFSVTQLLLIVVGSRNFSIAITNSLITVLGCALLLMSIGLARSTLYYKKKMQHFRTAVVPSKDLPTITVAIPARNETVDLQQCLESLVRSTYPKLEIIVLDDCSQNRRSPEIIKDFAHDGVRFLAGNEPPKGWLAKNYAYEQLLNAANGDYIVFCGVDARFQPETLRLMTEKILYENVSMLCVLPNNILAVNSFRAGLLQPLRYGWEISVPRSWSQHPPIISTSWMIRSSTVRRMGSFKAVHNTIQPERYFARECAKRNDYRFSLASPRLGLTSVKAFAEQYLTAVRTRYPQVHRRVEAVAAISFLEFNLVFCPVALAILACSTNQWLLLGINVITESLLFYTYQQLIALTYRSRKMYLWWFMPIAMAYDLYMINRSMYQYETTNVLWKGRNICIPLLEVIPSFPDLKLTADSERKL